MSQQIPASIPSPVSPAVAAPQAAPSADMGSTAYPQWVATTQGAPSATMPQAPSPVQQVTAPSTSNQSSQYPSAYSPSNPWEAAMGSLERVVSRLSPSPSQTAQYQQSPAQMPDTQLYSQSSLAQPYLYQAPSAQPTSYSNGYTTQTSSPTSTDAQQSAQLSPETTAVVNHFGIEAPGILNQYATVLEDALIQQHSVLENVAARGLAMETILTDPDHLADYTNRFFTEVYPVDETAPTENYQPRYDQLPAVPASAGAGAPSADPQIQWQGFGQVMNQNPEQAWRYLSQMGPEAFRSKLLFLDQA